MPFTAHQGHRTHPPGLSARARALALLPLSLLGLLFVLPACARAPEAPPTMNAATTSSATVHVLRLKPGEDLKGSLDAYARDHHLEAAVIVTCVGSLTTASLRFADRPDATQIEGKWEIVSLVGTLSASGGSHLHLAVSDGEGAMRGGHLMAGSTIYTTAEIAIAALESLRFERELDPTYGYKELAPKPAKQR